MYWIQTYGLDIFTQTENNLLDIVLENKVTLFICDELITELKRVLTYPRLARYKVNITAAIGFVKNMSVHFDLAYPIKRYITQDEYDDYIIALALQTNSGFITSGDNHILSEKKNLEKKYKKLKIITKAEFERMFVH